MLKLVATIVMAAFALAGILAPRDARPAPKAESAEECGVFTDMALTARAIAIEGGPSEMTLSILGRMYQVDERGEKIKRRIVAVAHGMGNVEPKDFAAQLYQHCTRGRGDMDGILGADI